MINTRADFYSLKNIATIFCIVVFYLLLSFFLIGFKTDQLLLAGIFCVAWFSNAVSRKFIIGFSIFIVYWIIFDYMKAFPNYCCTILLLFWMCYAAFFICAGYRFPWLLQPGFFLKTKKYFYNSP